MKKIFQFTIITIMFIAFFAMQKTYANEEGPSITVEDISIYQDSSNYIGVNFNNITDLSGLSFQIYFDSSLFLVNSYYLNGNFSDSNVYVYINEGVVTVSLINLDGINYSGNFINLYIQTKAGAEVGNYYVDIAVNEAYNPSLIPLIISSYNGSISIVEQIQQIDNVYLNTSISDTSLYQGDTFTYTVSSYNLNDLAAGNFEIYYDDQILQLIDVRLSSGLDHQNALYSVNSSTGGFIDISYISLTGLNYVNQIFYVDFEILCDINSVSEITLVPKNLYKESLEPLASDEKITSFNTFVTEVIVDNPNIYVTDYHGSLSNSFIVEVGIENTSELAAGDFHITYDETKLEIVNIVTGESITENGGFISYNPTYQNGDIYFSYINAEGLLVDETFLEITFTPINITDITNMNIGISGTGLVDSDFNVVEYDFISANIMLEPLRTIVYQDYDATLLQEYIVPMSETPEAPIPPYREHTTFNEWVLNEISDDYYIYQATYLLDPDIIAFNDTTINYDGASHSIYVSGLFDGVTVVYDTFELVDVGVHEITASIYLDDIYQYDLTATLSILGLSVDMSGITFEDLTTIYDGTEKIIEIEGSLPQGILSVNYINNALTDAGVLTATAQFTVDTGYNPVPDMTAVLTINKAELVISEEEFNITVSSNQIEIHIADFDQSINYSIDGTSYHKGNNITGLNEKTDYVITVYIEETNNYLNSNFININVTTYLSFTSFIEMAQVEEVNLGLRDIILNLMEQIDYLSSEDKIIAQPLIDDLILDYNNLVQSINDEYSAAGEISTRLKPAYSAASLLLFGLLAVDERREWL